MKILNTFWIPYEWKSVAPDLNGVIVWLQRLSSHARDDVSLQFVNLGCCHGNFPAPSWADYWARNKQDGQRMLEELLPCAEILMVNGSYDWLSFIAKYSALVASKPLTIATVHNDSSREYYDPLVYFESLIDHFIAVSPEVRDGLACRIPRRESDISVLPCFVPLPEPQYRFNKYVTPFIRLIYAGRVSGRQKRVFDLIELANHLRDGGFDFVLSILGDGGELEDLRLGFDNNGHSSRVRWYGQVHPDRVSAIIREHDIFVQVSEFEGTSTSMLEAMANGVVPVVTRASSGIEGIIREGIDGFSVPIGDMHALAERIGVLHTDRQYLHRLSLEGSSQASRFGWPVYRERLLEIIEAARILQRPAYWPRGRAHTPKSATWVRCWDQNPPEEHGRLDVIPMPAALRRQIRTLIHGR